MTRINNHGLTIEQEDVIYNYKIGCEGWFYFEALINDYACEPKKAYNWMVNYLFPLLKKQPKDFYGFDLSLIPPQILSGFIKANNRNGLKNFLT